MEICFPNTPWDIKCMDSQWLKTQFSLHPDKSKADLAAKLGLEASAISKILSGTRQIKAQEYMVMRAFFGMPSDGANSTSRHRHSYTLQPLGPGDGLREAEHDENAEWVIPASILNARTNAPPEKIRIFTVRENAMEPDFKQGEHVLVDLSDTAPSPPGVFIISDGFGHMIRRCAYAPKKNPPVIQISANSKQFESQALDADDFTMIGRVIAKLQMV